MRCCTGRPRARRAGVARDPRGRRARPDRVRLRHRDGSWRTVEAIGRRRRQDGEWVVVVNYRDVTDQRQLQEQLLHSQKLEAVGRLAGGVAHDFNNLLTAIRGYSRVPVAGFDATTRAREDALEIVRAADRAAALTRQLLAFSRREVLRAEVLDLDEVVAGIEQPARALIGEDVELVDAVAPGCLVRADRGTARAGDHEPRRQRPRRDARRAAR